MPATATLLGQKRSVNVFTTLIQIAFTGACPGDPGEVLSLLAKNLLNAGAKTITGPNGTPTIPPRVSSTQSGGWQMQLKPTGTAGEYNVSLWNGTAEHGASNYEAVITAGVFIVEIDHGLRG